jgi:hypothetical protein
MLAPLMPLPITTTSAVSGSSAVLRRSAMASGGSCQPLMVGLGRGRVGGIDARSSIVDVQACWTEEYRRSMATCHVQWVPTSLSRLRARSWESQWSGRPYVSQKVSDRIAILGLACPLLHSCGNFAPSGTASYFLLNLADTINSTVAQGRQRVSYAAAELSRSDFSKFTSKSHSEKLDLRDDFLCQTKTISSWRTPAVNTAIARAPHILQQDKPAYLL